MFVFSVSHNATAAVGTGMKPHDRDAEDQIREPGPRKMIQYS